MYFIGIDISKYKHDCFIMNENNQELLDMFNKGLANIKANGKYQEILDKYLK